MNPPVEYRTVEGYQHYKVGNDGTVLTRYVIEGGKRRLTPNWHRLKVTGNRGYVQVYLSDGPNGKTRSIHRLVRGIRGSAGRQDGMPTPRPQQAKQSHRKSSMGNSAGKCSRPEDE